MMDGWWTDGVGQMGWDSAFQPPDMCVLGVPGGPSVLLGVPQFLKGDMGGWKSGWPRGVQGQPAGQGLLPPTGSPRAASPQLKRG